MGKELYLRIPENFDTTTLSSCEALYCLDDMFSFLKQTERVFSKDSFIDEIIVYLATHICY